MWRDELIDLSRRNRLISLPLSGRTTALEITAPELDEVIAGLSAPPGGGWRFHYPPVEDEEALEADPSLLAALEAEDPDLDEEIRPDELVTTAATASKLSTRLRTTASRASSEYMDKGLRVLYLAAGMLEWSDGEGNELISPLVLIPVVLERSSPREPYRLRDAEEDWVVNPALGVKLQQEFGVDLPSLDGDYDIASFLAQVDDLFGDPAWKVTKRLALATLSFAKETMYRDLLDNEAVILEHPIVAAMGLGDVAGDDLAFDRIPDEDLDQRYPPEQLNSILDADATQRACIVAAKEGNTFVMDGPPGSGKSQTIANIIAEVLAEGRSVLFVSEKAAALEVVKNRLDEAHLGEFVLELHSHKATRKEVASALGHSLLRRVNPPGRRSDPDTAYIGARRIELSAYAAAMNQVRSPLGRTLHDVLGRCGQLGETPLGPPPEDLLDQLSAEDFRAMVDGANRLANAWGPVERGEAFLWRQLSPHTLESPAVRIGSSLDGALQILADLQERANAFHQGVIGPRPQTFADHQRLSELSGLLDSRPDVDEGWLTIHDFSGLVGELESLERKAGRHKKLAATMAGIRNDWRTMPVGTLLADSVHSLDGALGAAERPPELTIAVLEEITKAAEQETALLQEIGSEAGDLRVLVGLPREPGSFADLESLLELVDLAAAPRRPERAWLDEQTLSLTHDAIRLVRPLLDEWVELEAQVRQRFNDNIKTLDIEQLYESESAVEPKLGRLSSRGRSNRRQLAACAVSGKVTPDVIAALPIARSWKRLSNRLENLEDAEVLGRYYEGARTDLVAVESAVAVAERALVLAGPDVDRSALSAAVSRDALDLQGLGAKRARLGELMEEWRLNLEVLRPIVPEADPSSELLAVRTEMADLAGRLRSILIAGEPYVVDPEVENLEALELRERDRSEVEQIEQAFSSISDSSRLGRSFSGMTSNWESINEALAWSTRVRQLFGGELTPAAAEAVTVAERDIDYERLLVEARKAVSAVPLFFDGPRQVFVADELADRVDDTVEFLAGLRSSMADLEEWRRFDEARTDLAGGGFSELVRFAEESELRSSELPDLFERTVLRTWADQILATDRRLRPERAVDRDSAVAEFRRLDGDLARQAARRVVETCNDRRPTSKIGEAAILQREAEKKRKHRPVRELLTAAGRTAQDVKPCFMMSPLAVSQFLPPDLWFDVVVFDEASQVRPCDAINAIYRGEQLIIAGDERQLPPTSFFDKIVGDDSDIYDEEETADFESVLKLAQGSAGINSLPLRWHYRSRHESLITFSNREFYENQLVTYPGAIQEAGDLGVHFVEVPEGRYLRGGARDNPEEARVVVERVLHHASSHPELTLGVVAFSEAQASRIGYELEAARRQRPDLDDYFGEDRLDGFFVKNLESVQGDERDVIIFSIGYGPDEHGKVTMNFGPLNREGGHRRLNVAVTRARRRVEVVSSITAADFTDTSNARGVRSLRRYLDFAQRGLAAFAVDETTDGEPESPFEEDVIAVVRSLGYEVIPQVGQAGFRIDMAVRDPHKPGRYVLGIECDGAAYHSSVVARDRDRLRQEVLEGLGWRLHRIWGSSWYRERDHEIQRLGRAIDAAVKGGVELPTPAPVTAQEPIVEEVEEELAPWAHLYEPFVPDVGGAAPLENPNSLPPLRNALREIVSKLAPVHADTCVAAVREAWGVERMGSRRRDRIEYALSSLVSQGALLQDRYGFYWTSGEQQVVVRAGTRDSPESIRQAALVSPDEVEPRSTSWYRTPARSIRTSC